MSQTITLLCFQSAMDVVVNPPQPGELSHDQYVEERDHVLADLNNKARMTSELLNAIDGITCNEVMGAMYAFPRVHLPPKAVEEAKVRDCIQSIYLLI